MNKTLEHTKALMEEAKADYEFYKKEYEILLSESNICPECKSDKIIRNPNSFMCLNCGSMEAEFTPFNKR